MKRKSNNGAGVSTLAQSEEVGLLLVFSITITSMGVILMMGVPALNDAKENAQIQRVETEFGSLDRQISSAAFGGGQTQARVNIQQGDFNFEPDAGWINISYYNGSDTIWENKSLPSITYTHVDSMISYQGGGIWTKYGDGTSTMSSPPDINLRGNTLNIALINITSGGFQTAGATDLFTFTHNGSHRMKEFRDLGPLSVGSLNLTIHSQHYRGWARYFNETGWETVKVYSSNNTVRATNPTGSPPFGQALLSSGSNRMRIRNSQVDSYDSRVGNYSSETSLGAGNVLGKAEVEFRDGSIVNGSVTSDTVISCGSCGNSQITGDAVAGSSVQGSTTPTPGQIYVHGDITIDPDTNVEVPTPISSTIQDAVNEFNTPFWSSTQSCGASCRLITSGDYEASNNINGYGGTLRFDTSNGPIRVALTNDVFRLDGSPKIEITGSNPVLIFRDRSSASNAFRLQSLEMDVEGNRTDLFQVYVRPQTSGNPTKVGLEDTEFYGVIYAPENKDMDFLSGTEIFGALIGNEIEIRNSELHYDHSLVELELPAVGATRITHLHATDNRVGAR